MRGILRGKRKMKQKHDLKGQQSRGTVTDAMTESISCWCLPATIKNRFYKNAIHDVYQVAACSKYNLMDMGFNGFEIALIVCTLRDYQLSLRENE